MVAPRPIDDLCRRLHDAAVVAVAVPPAPPCSLCSPLDSDHPASRPCGHPSWPTRWMQPFYLRSQARDYLGCRTATFEYVLPACFAPSSTMTMSLNAVSRAGSVIAPGCHKYRRGRLLLISFHGLYRVGLLIQHLHDPGQSDRTP